MQGRQHALQQLMMGSRYSIDPDLVAGAILARAMTRQLVPEARFRNDPAARTVSAQGALAGAGGPDGRILPIIRPVRVDRDPGSAPDPDAWA